MTHGEIAKQYFCDGYNCAQAVLLAFAGEVGLSGEVRPVARIEQRISEAEKLGFQHIIIPKYNLAGLNQKKFKIELVPVRKVEEALRALFG